MRGAKQPPWELLPGWVQRWLFCSLLPWGLVGCDPPQRRDDKALGWEATPHENAQGPRYEDQDFVLEVGAPALCEKPGALAPEQGWSRLTVPIQVEAITLRQVPVSPLSFALQDDEGHRFFPTLAGCEPAFEPRKLSRSEFSGHVTFDVPAPQASYELLFEPFLIGRKPIVARARLPKLRGN